MKIRPLHKTLAGNYISDDKKWIFVKKRKGDWSVYKLSLPDHYSQPPDYFRSTAPFFYYRHPTLYSLIESLENFNV